MLLAQLVVHKLARIPPGPLFQHDHIVTIDRELAGEDTARGTGADDDEIDGLSCRESGTAPRLAHGLLPRDPAGCPATV